ncbi:cation/H(+) antiporter 15-like isoform X2 [Tasmannia lanceolata]|uniref:cation/H(+) antiporter 15-like isoform X2 n=1 Tax=Tasmannia lanceolata TaxID=3420 RepID=UPI0040634D99
MTCGFITDALGINSIFGAFVFGLVIPNGPLGISLMEKLEDFVSGLLLPLYFAISGLRTNVYLLSDFSTWAFLLLVIILASAGKVVGTMAVAFFYKMPFREGFTLGMLMNTKGLIEMIVLNIGRDQKESPYSSMYGGESDGAPVGCGGTRGGAAGDDDAKILMVITDYEKEKQLDDDFISEFRVKNVNDESVVYMEKVVNDGEETVAAIRCMDSINDLYIVGRGQGTVSPLTTGMTDWSECPELGAIGDLLASSDFSATVSVLVIQQYVGAVPNDVLGTPDSPSQQIEQYLNNNNARRMPHRGQGSYFG